MPMLADMENPPRGRGRDLLVGVALAVPVCAALFGWLIPTFVGAIVGGASTLDTTLRAQDRYMQQVCGAPDLPRDEVLCGCVLAMEFPALDCQEKFRPWLLERTVEYCRDPAAREVATSLCVCATTVAETLATSPTEPEALRQAGQAMDRCLALPDAPALEGIYPPAVGVATSA